MTENHHVIGKMIFRIKVPDRSGTQDVFQRISDLYGDRLLSTLDQLLTATHIPHDVYITIDQMSVPVGVISLARMESEILEALEKKIRELLPKYIPAGDLSLPTMSLGSRKLLLLEFFLTHGRYPWWATNKAALPGDVSTLLSGLSSGETILATMLGRLLKEEVIRRRFLRQVISTNKTRYALLSALFHESPEIVDLLITETAGSMQNNENDKIRLWEAVIKTSEVYAGKPGGTAALKAHLLVELKNLGAAMITSGKNTNGPTSSLKKSDKKLPPEVIVPTATIGEQALSQEIGAVLFFLKNGRFPEGFLFRSGQMDEILIGWLQNAPVRARSALLQLNREVNLAFRLEQQFSTDVVKVLFGVLFPDQSLILNQVLSDITVAVSRRRKGLVESGFIWYAALGHLLKKVDRRINFMELLAFTGIQIAAKSGTDTASVWSVLLLPELRKKTYATVTREYLQLYSGVLSDPQTRDLIQEISTWSEKTNNNTETAFVKIFSRLSHQEKVWWDTDTTDITILLNDLSAFPRSELVRALSYLSSVRSIGNWIPILQQETFYQFLAVLWGDLSTDVLAFEEQAKRIATEQKLSFQKAIWWKILLEYALQNKPATNETFTSLMNRSAAQATGRSEEDWKKWLGKNPGKPGRFKDHKQQKFPNADSSIENRPKKRGKKHPDELDTLMHFGNPEIPLPYPDRIRQELFLIRTFLNQGVIPPGSAIMSPDEMEYMLLRLMHKHTNLVLPVLTASLRNPDAADRILHFFSVPLLRETGKVIMGNDFEKAQKLWAGLMYQLKVPLQRSAAISLERHFYAVLFSKEIAGQHTGMNEKLFISEAITRISKEEHIQLAELFKFLKEPGNVQQPVIQAAAEEVMQQIIPKQVSLQRDQTPQEESVFIHNAGLVILAPYLTRYFDTLGMLKNNEFKDGDAAERSVHLLQYIASNQSETPEHLLVFNKVLCGLPIDTPVTIGITLTKEEKDISAFLLNTVIQNWDRMKTSTVTNLQATFLLREGRLVEKQDKWLLNIEKKAFDILLDFIPWTFSMIKLPWMKKRIEVTWNKKS